MTRTPELDRVFLSAFLSACYVMNAKSLRPGEKALAGRVAVRILMHQEMPSAADVATIDEACDRVLEAMSSRLARFVLAERAARRALIGGAS